MQPLGVFGGFGDVGIGAHVVGPLDVVAIGGGGGLCGAAIANLLGIRDVVVPKFASSFSAWSMFVLDMGRDYLRSYFSNTTDIDFNKVNQLYEDMMNEAWMEFKALKISRQDIIFEKSADVRYRGQYHEIEMPLPAGEITSKDIQSLEQQFHDKHKEIYTFSMEWVPSEIRNLHLIAKVKTRRPAFHRIKKGTEDASEALKCNRQCFFDGSFKKTAVYDGTQLKAGSLILGPSIIEEPTTTVIVPDGFNCNIDENGNYLLKKI